MLRGRIQLVRGLRADAGDRVIWRVLGDNHRDLGRSAVSYPDADEARAAVVRARAAAPAVTVAADPATGRWVWRLTADDEVLLQSSRSFQRRRESEASAALVVALLPTAAVAPAVLDMQHRRRDTARKD